MYKRICQAVRYIKYNKYPLTVTMFIPDTNTGSYIYYDVYSKYFRKNHKAILGRTLKVHALRHTHTAMLAEARVPLETISRRLGHADSKVTPEVYMHITNNMRDHDRDLLSKVRICRF